MCRLRNIAMHDYQESVTTGHCLANEFNGVIMLEFKISNGRSAFLPAS